MIELPVKAEPNQRFSVVLNNQDCTIELFQRYDRLYLNLFVNDAPVVLGVVCLDRVNLAITSSPLFKGFLYFADTLGDSAPQWEGLGSRYWLIFAREEEMVEVVPS